MTVPMFQKYKPSKHFQERVEQRFMIQPTMLNDWIKGLLQKAEYNRSQTSSRKIYRVNNIELVVDSVSFTLITIYSLKTQETIEDEIKLNPEIASVLNEAMRNLKNRIIRRTSKRVAKFAQENADLYKKISNSRNNKYIDEWYNKISDNNADIQTEINKQNDLLDQIDMKLA